MKKIFFLIIWISIFQTLSLADDIRYFQIEEMRIGDSALDYFSESQLENNEQGWHNYSYNEYSTSYILGKGIYNWFLVSYRNDDYSFKIEALAGGLEKINYDDRGGRIFHNVDTTLSQILYKKGHYVAHYLYLSMFPAYDPSIIK